MVKKYVLIILVLFIISNSTIYFTQTYGQKLRERPFNLSPSNPHVFDSRLKVEQVAQGLELPTTMAFLGPDDFLVLEKDKGTV
jgi:aldose sugar dehydrogenase